MNTKLTEANFLPMYPVTTHHLSTYHVNIGSIDPIVGLDVPSGARPTRTELLEKSSIFKQNL